MQPDIDQLLAELTERDAELHRAIVYQNTLTRRVLERDETIKQLRAKIEQLSQIAGGVFVAG